MSGQAGSDAAQQVAHSKPFQVVARVGLATYGVVNLLVGWLALQVATGDGGGQQTDKQGALGVVAATGGAWLLWVIAVGIAATALWLLYEAFFGFDTEDKDRKKYMRRINAGAKAVFFGYLSVSAGKTAAGSSSQGSGSEQGLIATIMSHTWGKILIALVGIGFLVAAGFVIRRVVKERFVRDLDLSSASAGTRKTVIKLGQIGYSAQALVYVVIGVLIIYSAVQSDPAKATGLDVALKTLAAQPFGVFALIVVAIGLAVFGVYTFFDARYRRTSR